MCKASPIQTLQTMARSHWRNGPLGENAWRSRYTTMRTKARANSKAMAMFSRWTG